MEVVLDKSFNSDQYKIIEIPIGLEEWFNGYSNETIVIQSEPNGSKRKKLVLKTNDQTYRLRKVDNSNTNFILPFIEKDETLNSSPQSVSVISTFTQTHELTLIKPDFSILKKKLVAACKDNVPMTISNIELYCQGSISEIIEFLRSFNCVEIDGKWLKIDDEEYDTLLANFILFLFKKKTSSFQILKSALTEFLSDKSVALKSIFIENLVKNYSSQTYVELEDSEKMVDIQETELLKHILTNVFKENRRVAKADISEVLESYAPKDVIAYFNQNNEISEKLLSSISVQKEGYYYRFFAKDMAESDEKSTFERLFSFKKDWTMSEIKPFVLHLSTVKRDQESILKKFTVVMTVKGKQVLRQRK